MESFYGGLQIPEVQIFSALQRLRGFSTLDRPVTAYLECLQHDAFNRTMHDVLFDHSHFAHLIPLAVRRHTLFCVVETPAIAVNIQRRPKLLLSQTVASYCNLAQNF